MLYYRIDKGSLWDLIDEEVSRVADEAYTEDGTSLYDVILLTEKDRSTIERFMDDAISKFVSREFDVTKYSPETEEDANHEIQLTGIMRLAFDVPDFDDSMTTALYSELNRYIVMFACANLFQQRRVALVQEYSARAQSAMDKAVSILKSRKHPLAT